MRLAGTLIGMVHLPPLPGSPRWGGAMSRVVEAALRDAGTLVAGGIDALLVENFGDVPFAPRRVAAATVAAMTAAALEVRRAFPAIPLGVNVLRSDGRSALAVASVVEAAFIRVNVHTGAVLADQGIVRSDAYRLLRDRRALGAEVAVLADVQTKHAVPLAPQALEQEARDAVERGLADGVIVTGRATGDPAAPGDVERVRAAVPGVPVVVGSGVSPESVAGVLAVADAVIVGTALKHGGDVHNPVDPERVRALVAAARGR